MTSAGSAGIAFQPIATADFDQILKDAEELLHGTAEETGLDARVRRRRVRLPLDRS